MESHGLKYVVTPKQRDLFGKISRKTQDNGWSTVEDLTKLKTISVMTSLEWSLKELEQKGLIQRKLNRFKEFVRVIESPAIKRLCDLFELNI